MNRLEWLDTATRKISFRPDRKAVRKELEAHFEDLREARGLDEEAAAAAMGCLLYTSDAADDRGTG